MISFLKKVITSVSPWKSPEPGDELTEEKVVEKINSFNSEPEVAKEIIIPKQKFQGQTNDVKYEIETFKCIHKAGKVTQMCEEYGVIDNAFCFKPSQIAVGINLKLNDEVYYSAYKAKENEVERVFKVYGTKSTSWEGEGDGDQQPELADEAAKEEEEIAGLSRVVTGRVTKRKGREVYIDSANIWCNLDNIQATYVPVEGDWVELNAVVSISPETADLSGEILIVKSLKPLLKKSAVGRITFWSDTDKEGAIENNIYFSNRSCESGYFPELGDEVFYDAVESDQDRFRWRATKVLYAAEAYQSKYSAADAKRAEEATDIYNNKNDITIVPSVCNVAVQLNSKKAVEIEVINDGTAQQSVQCKLLNQANPQVKLVKPESTKEFFILPQQAMKFRFYVEGKILGFNTEVVYFHFKDFEIARKIEINVVSNLEMNKVLKCDFRTTSKIFKKRKLAKRYDPKDGVLALHGPRPWKPPKFISTERKCVHHLPKTLWTFAYEHQNQLTMQTVLKYAPFLKEDLNFDQYAERFHTLLYIEELQRKLSMRNYDMTGVSLERSDEYLILSVPELGEKLFSKFFGIKVILTQPWSKENKIRHIGYIHAVRKDDLSVKFHPSFHDTYDGSECDISFEENNPYFPNCHDAINRAMKMLGKSVLFPCAVNEKPPLLNLDLSEEKGLLMYESGNACNNLKAVEMNESESKENVNPNSQNKEKTGTPLKNKLNNNGPIKINWINKRLNDRQKLAIVNALQAKGRPLPYIIFGPPGTGKTITLVELIIQIYRLIPDSRILVATPSNSSADLICERLIDAGEFKPGELVRPVAVYRVFEGLVSAKLLPYSSVYSGEITKSEFHPFEKNNVKVTCLNNFTGRHRITIGTCITTGALHYAGLSPGHFTHILMDEAGQFSEPEALISLTFQTGQNTQVVLTGDPQQLGPLIFNPAALKCGLAESLLQRLISVFPYTKDYDSFQETSGYDPRFITKLVYNYRSLPEILSLPSQMFYNSDLIPTVHPTESKEADIVRKFNFRVEGRDSPPAIIFHGLVGQNLQEINSPSWYNPHEVWQVVFYVKKLYSIGLNCDDIGIITPYSKQVSKLKAILISLNLSTPKIGSVEEFQGQERNVIILSIVRSSLKRVSEDVMNALGFVASPQRLNVGLTRARALLIIIGNPIVLSKDPYWANVINYCVNNKSYTGCNLETYKAEAKKNSSSSTKDE